MGFQRCGITIEPVANGFIVREAPPMDGYASKRQFVAKDFDEVRTITRKILNEQLREWESLFT